MDDAVTASHETDASEKQFAANRANATHSTGPRTDEGKARSRLNALKHGLLASEAANFGVEGEPARRVFEDLSERLEDYYRPRGPIEEILVQKIAIATWRLKRAMRYEARNINEAHQRYWATCTDWSYAHKGRTHPYLVKLAQWGIEGVTLPDAPQMSLLLRYEGAINRDLYRAMGELRKMRKERESSEEPKDAAVESPKADAGAADAQNYQTNPNPPPVDGANGLKTRIEGETPPPNAPSP